MNNSARVSGEILEFGFSHNVREMPMYKGIIACPRESGMVDQVPFITRGTMDLRVGDVVALIGELRTYNTVPKTHCVYVKDVEEIGYAPENTIVMEGIIVRTQPMRETPFGRQICDFCIAYNAPYRGSSYYPNCIAWGSTAKRVSGYSVGDKVRIIGRFQSRDYTKVLEDGSTANRTAYEISCQTVELVEE